METFFVNTEFNLKPWLNARTAKVFVLFPYRQNEYEFGNQVGSLFSYFLPNLHAIALVREDFKSRSMLTAGLLKKYGQRIHLIPQRKDDSDGVALLQGLTYAMDHGAKNIIQLSKFSATEITYIPKMLDYADQYDLIIGSRFLEPQEFICPQKQWQYSIDRWINANLLHRLMGSRITDANSSVRCWSRVALQLILSRLRFRNSHWLNLEMVYLSYRNHLRLKEIPIKYKPTVLENNSADRPPPYLN